MPAITEMTGKRYGRLLVLHRGETDKHSRYKWLCQCDCGNLKEIAGYHLRSGHTKSCGCYQIDFPAARTHGKVGTPEYQAWCKMKDRCYNPKDKRYEHYGARGIKVCKCWRESFENFFKDMGTRPSPKHSLDRIDNNGPYHPRNCRWATDFEQANNKTSNYRISWCGQVQSRAVWERDLGFPVRVIYNRMRKGWSLKRAFTFRVNSRLPRVIRLGSVPSRI